MNMARTLELLKIYDYLDDYMKVFEETEDYQEVIENEWDIDECFELWLENNEEVQRLVSELEEDDKAHKDIYSYYGVSERDFY